MTAGEPLAPLEPVVPVGDASRLPAPHLRLVVEPDVEHEHEWRLRGVEFDDGGSVREFGCGSCDAVWFD
ncbi:hypothetical protein [Nocardioides dongkuii]|uniref:hypothetical protein n=1 Tax=Nocardioides dongkuii TaxID=2760089 RepID=UPI0015FCB8FE|nr:hypothetical protein [Nocardioides dongkuii]